jgi:ABC-type lipoprotein export system ATPase subunit
LTAPVLEARSACFRYGRAQPLIEGFSARFGAGEMVAITGPSGRGKSTLLYLLGLMLRPDSGEVLLHGEPTRGLPDRAKARARASRYGFVFQDAALDPSRSVLDNVLEPALYRAESRAELRASAQRLLREFQVDLRQDARPGQVSGGQAQRIALCRALLGSPSVLLADEPTGNLDAATAERVVDAIRTHTRRGNTAVIVTHDTGLASTCDRQIEI